MNVVTEAQPLYSNNISRFSFPKYYYREYSLAATSFHTFCIRTERLKMGKQDDSKFSNVIKYVITDQIVFTILIDFKTLQKCKWQNNKYND